MTGLLALVIPARVMDRDTVVPQGTGARSPLEPDLDVHVLLVHVVQVVQDQVALGLVETHDLLRHGAVDPEGFPAGGRVHAHDGVDALDVLGAGVGVIAVEVLVRADVDGLAAVDDLAELGAQFGVGGVPAGPEGVAAEGWDGVVVQVGDPGRVLLMYKVAV